MGQLGRIHNTSGEVEIGEMTAKKKTYLKYIIWINLALGLQNLYFYVNNDSIFNLIIGALNIGVWVFYRGKVK